MYGVYKWGNIREMIDQLKGDNNKYESEIQVLQMLKTRVGNEVNSIQKSIASLQTEASILDDSLKQFDALRQELMVVAHTNAEIGDMIATTNTMFKNIKKASRANARFKPKNTHTHT